MVHPDPIRPEPALAGLRPGAIFRGFLWDNGLTLVFALVLASALLEGGLDADEAEYDALFSSTGFLLLMLPIGAACTVFGGYLAAASAGVAHLKNAVAVGVADVVLGLLGLLLPASGPPPPLWTDLLGFALVIPSAALGGWLALARDT